MRSTRRAFQLTGIRNRAEKALRFAEMNKQESVQRMLRLKLDLVSVLEHGTLPHAAIKETAFQRLFTPKEREQIGRNTGSLVLAQRRKDAVERRKLMSARQRSYHPLALSKTKAGMLLREFFFTVLASDASTAKWYQQSKAGRAELPKRLQKVRESLLSDSGRQTQLSRQFTEFLARKGHAYDDVLKFLPLRSRSRSR